MQAKLGIIGMGKIGKKLLPLFANSFDVSTVYTPSNSPIDFLKIFDESIKHTTKIDELLSDSEIKAVAILSPNTTHYEYVKKCLEFNKDVFVEKPPTTSSTEIDELNILANQRNKIVFVDHTFSYMNSLSQLNYSKIKKINMLWKKHGSFNNNIFWNLFYHDAYLALEITGSSDISNIMVLKNQADHIVVEFNIADIKIRSEIDRKSKGNIKQLTIINQDEEFIIVPENNLLSKVVSHFHELITINKTGIHPVNSVNTVKIVEKVIEKSQ